MVVVVGLTVVDPSGVPPQLPVYQSTTSPPLPGVADRVDEAPTHIVEGLAVAPVGAAGSFTVSVVVAQLEFPQLAVSQRT